MKALSNFFAQFDLFECPANLRIRGDDTMKNSSVGFISFLISCLFIYVFINGCIGILTYQNINATLSDTIYAQEDAIGYFDTIAVGIDNLTIQQIDSMFQFMQTVIGDLLVQADWTAMVPCKPQHWIGLGENYNATFYQYGMDQMYCINYSNSIRLNQTMVSWTATGFQIQLFNCDYLGTKNCNTSKTYDYIYYKNPQVRVYILDTGFFPEQKISRKPFVNTDGKIKISWAITATLQIQYARYRIETDQSLISFASNQSATGIWVHSIQNYPRPFNINWYLVDFTQITVYMNQNLRVYMRTIGKLDDLISYVGGLFQILIGFIAYFLLSFNQYRYELSVSEGAFDFKKDGRKIKSEDLGFLTYIKYGIYEWINTLFCMKLKWKLCNNIEQIKDQIVSLMEVNKFYKRVRNAETAVTYALGESKTNLIKLVQPPSINKVKNRKLKIEYYDKITGQNNSKNSNQKNTEAENIEQINNNSQSNNQSQQKQKRRTKSINLSPQMLEMEKNFAISLQALTPKHRNEYEEKIFPQILKRIKQIEQ